LAGREKVGIGGGITGMIISNSHPTIPKMRNTNTFTKVVFVLCSKVTFVAGLEIEKE
jgi:hypothetical protein